jgi:hypothetical protein
MRRCATWSIKTFTVKDSKNCQTKLKSHIQDDVERFSRRSLWALYKLYPLVTVPEK